MVKNTEKMIILGSGPAGLTAAIYAARANLNPLVLEGIQPGGQLMITTDVDNYPGFDQGVMGPDLMLIMKKQAERFGTRFKQVAIDRVELDGTKVLYAGADAYHAHSLVISTGATAKLLDLESESKLMGHGVSACATCDGFFFKDKVIAVVGGGDTAMEEATFLTKFGSRVYVIHRRDKLRASKSMQERAFDNPKLEFIWDTTVTEILGTPETGVNGVRLHNLKSGEDSTLECQGFFVAIGHNPNTEIFKDQLEMDETGYLKVEPYSTRTNVAGVFAAGDAADKVYRQAVTAAGTGCMAALDAEKYLVEIGEAE